MSCHRGPLGAVRSRVSLCITCLAVLLVVPPVILHADEQGDAAARPNYDLASRWTTEKMSKLVFDTAVVPHWLEFSDRFWYSFETPQGKQYFLVDPARRSKVPLFDHARMAAMLTVATRIPYDRLNLPIKALKFIKNDAALEIEVEVPQDAVIPGLKPPPPARSEQTSDDDAEVETDDPEESKRSIYFEYELAGGALTLLGDFDPPGKKPRWASVSPDDQTIVFARGHNLYMMDAASYALALEDREDASIVETQLTTDGEEHYSYARRLNDEDRKELRKDLRDKDERGGRVPPITIHWSKDSKKLAVVRQDQRKVADLWVINSVANPRPKLESYRYAMPGEPDVPQPEILVFEVATKKKVALKIDRFKDQSVAIQTAPVTALLREKEKTEPQWLNEGSDKIYFTRTSRDMHRVDVCEADTVTGESTVLIEERLNTYIETKPLLLIADGQELVHWSERDGWGHYYLYDRSGIVKNQITSGEFVSTGVVGIDQKARVMFFTAVGREPGEDPSYVHLYRVSLDGSGMKLLNPGDASHAVDMNDSHRYFVSTFSRVDTAPTSVLYDSAGTLLAELDTADVTAIEELGFRYPERFKVKADDGITDLFGVMYKPFDFDREKKYPIIASVYPGPQQEGVTRVFSPRSANHALAQFGFIVVEVGNRGGNPLRSKSYHNYGYGNLRDYGLADKKAAIEQLARRHSFIDIDRVGIFGHSGGGFMSTAAMLIYPDFFKVAVSSSGNHDNNVYNKNWSEKHHGVKEVTDDDGDVRFEYSIDTNSEIAGNLKGKLLLVTGDMDDNVHMAGTLRVAAALIKAKKRFDFFMFPGVRHSFNPVQDYFFWLRADYFCRHLLGESASSVDILELVREQQQNGRKNGTR